MSQYIKVNGIKNLRRALERGQRNIRKECDKAVMRTAEKAVRPIKRRVPVAFGELRDSVQAYPRGKNGHPVTAVEAPHAGAVEIGSAPHKPNFERLLAWVKLRGLQSLTKRGRLRKRALKSWGFNSAYQVPRIGRMFKGAIVKGKGGRNGHGRYSPTDTPEMIAQQISKGIEKHGTKPHWYVRESLGEISQILSEEMSAAKARITG